LGLPGWALDFGVRVGVWGWVGGWVGVGVGESDFFPIVFFAASGFALWAVPVGRVGSIHRWFGNGLPGGFRAARTPAGASTRISGSVRRRDVWRSPFAWRASTFGLAGVRRWADRSMPVPGPSRSGGARCARNRVEGLELIGAGWDRSARPIVGAVASQPSANLRRFARGKFRYEPNGVG